MLVLISLIEVACRRLPSANSQGIIGTVGSLVGRTPDDQDFNVRDGVEKRGLRSSTVTTTFVQSFRSLCVRVRANIIHRVHGTRETLVVIQSQTDTCPSGHTCAPNPNFWLDVGTITIGYVAVETVPTTPAPVQSPTTLPLSNPVKSTPPTTTTPPAIVAPTTTTPAVLSTTIPVNPATSSSGAQTNVLILHIFTLKDYFLGAFLPTILAVLFTIPWGILDSTVKELEPF